MADTAFIAGEFYQGQFVSGGLIPGQTELLIDKRYAVLVEIAAKPHFDTFIMSRRRDILTNPDNLSLTHVFYYVAVTGGIPSLVITGTWPGTPAKPFNVISSFYPPSYFIMSDELGGIRYMTVDQVTRNLVVTATKPAIDDYLGQFVGPYIEMVADDGKSIYRLSVTSTNGKILALNRVEERRVKPILVSQGHPFPYDRGQDKLWIEAMIKFGETESRIPQSKTGFGGLGERRTGSIEIQLIDKEFDPLVNQTWDKRTIEAKADVTTNHIGDYPVILRGSTQRASHNQDTTTIDLTDDTNLFDKNIQTNTYLGTGTLANPYEGDLDLRGNLKPYALGFIRDGTPVLINSALNLYQINDGQVHLVLFGSQGAVPMPVTANMSDLSTWNPTSADAGTIRTDLTRGLVRCASRPTGRFTVTFYGSTDVPFNPGKAHVVRAMINKSGVQIGIDETSFNEHISRYQGVESLHLTEKTTIRQGIDTICQDTGHYAIMSRLHLLRMGYLARSTPRAFLDDRIILDGTVSRRDAPTPGSQYRMSYQKEWTVLDDGEILEAASDDLRPQVKNEWRYVNYKFPPFVVPRYDSAESVELFNYSEFSVEVQLVDTMMRDYAWRDIYELTIAGYSFLLDVGDTVLVQYPRWGLNMPRSMVIIGIVELMPTEETEDQTRLTLVG
jgi:hypothetical protein